MEKMELVGAGDRSTSVDLGAEGIRLMIREWVRIRGRSIIGSIIKRDIIESGDINGVEFLEGVYRFPPLIRRRGIVIIIRGRITVIARNKEGRGFRIGDL